MYNLCPVAIAQNLVDGGKKDISLGVGQQLETVDRLVEEKDAAIVGKEHVDGEKLHSAIFAEANFLFVKKIFNAQFSENSGIIDIGQSHRLSLLGFDQIFEIGENIVIIGRPINGIMGIDKFFFEFLEFFIEIINTFHHRLLEPRRDI